MIRSITREDIDEVIRLTDQENWRYGTEDIARLMRLDPRGCLVLEDNEIRGCVFAMAMGSKGVIGGLIVDKECRSMGLGKELMGAALKHLEETSPTIELFSYEHTVPFYRKMGFEEDEMLVRMVGETTSMASEENTRPITHHDLEWLRDYDRRVFNGDRMALLKDLVETGVAVRGDGYGMAKGNPSDCFDLGPIVCKDGSLWRALMGMLPSGCVEMSIPYGRKDALDEAKKWGMKESFRNVRMVRGRKERLHPLIWAIGGLEKG